MKITSNINDTNHRKYQIIANSLPMPDMSLKIPFVNHQIDAVA
jgi:hypothetical protein